MDLAWLLAPPRPAATPLRQLLHLRLRAAIVDGRLATGCRLPASRTLAAELGVARNTVIHAYQQLIAEGCLDADRHGTRVAALPAAHRAASGPRPTPPTLPGLSARARVGVHADDGHRQALLPLAPGMPELGAFPFRSWRACLERAWRNATARQLGYAPHGGEPALRAALAAHLAGTRGFAVAPEQVIVTAGAQSALDLCARLLADAGDTAWIENPGYPWARTALGLAGLALHPVAIDDEGMAPAPAAWTTRRPRLILVTPTHQYPSGREMSLARRLALIDQARAAGAWIIEDDYDSEFRRHRPAQPALYGLRDDAPVIHCGTFSKTLYPGLRIGYLVVPGALAEAFARAAAQSTRPGQGIEQAALAEFIERGHYTAHLRRMRRRYDRRQHALRAALARHPGPETAITGGGAGLHLTLWLPPQLDDRKVCAAAAELGLGVRALSRYTLPPLACNGLLLGYGNTDEAVIDAAVRRLRTAMQHATRPAPPPQPTPT